MNNKQMQNVTTGSIYLPQNQSNINKTRCKSIYIYINLKCYTNKDRVNWEEKGKGEERVSQRERERERERESYQWEMAVA